MRQFVTAPAVALRWRWSAPDVAKLFWVASGGALGAVLRFGMVSATHRLVGSGFPWGTLLVNVLGSLAIGVLWAMAERAPLTAAMSAFLFVGVLGSFTTFATFAIESSNLIRDGRELAAVMNIVASNATCILAAFAGLRIGRLFLVG